MAGTYTIELDELYDIATRIYNKYIDISEYKYMQVKGITYNEAAFERELDELKSLLLQERVLYDGYYKKWTSEEIDFLVTIETDEDDLFFKRIQTKILDVMHDPYVISREALDNLKVECRIIVDRNEEKEIYKDILNELNAEKFTMDGPEIEIFKNFLTFLSVEIEQQKDEDVLKLLIMEFFFSIFSDPRLEEKIVNSGFKIDKELIRISDSISLSDIDYKEYKENLNELLTNKTSATLIEIFEDGDYEENLENQNTNFATRILQTIGNLFNQPRNSEIDEYNELDENYFQSIDILLKCDLRAAMYVFDDEQFEKYVNFLNAVIKSNQNHSGVKLIEEAIEEARLDRKKFPKMMLLGNQTSLEKIESEIVQLYEELINYQKRRYNGEDVDEEIQKIIDKLKEERVIEVSEVQKELLEDFEEEDLETYGQIILNFRSRFETPETKVRVMEIANLFARYLSLKVIGYPEPEFYNVNDDSLEVNKNILFFLEQTINCTEGEVRDFLIEYKFNLIYSSYKLEEIALQSNFEISREHLCFPSIIVNDIDEKIDYYNQSKENIFRKLEIVLNEFHSMNKTITPCMEGQIYKYISLFRGMLYTLGDKSFQTYSEALELVTPQIRDEITISLLQTVMELSTLDRETYKKLIF